ncbi:hypothetical protein NL676_032250 [Syzygium grande]|nr:hypothetical protein NL676_032250 [Syzygium grande]
MANHVRFQHHTTPNKRDGNTIADHKPRRTSKNGETIHPPSPSPHPTKPLPEHGDTQHFESYTPVEQQKSLDRKKKKKALAERKRRKDTRTRKQRRHRQQIRQARDASRRSGRRQFGATPPADARRGREIESVNGGGRETLGAANLRSTAADRDLGLRARASSGDGFTLGASTAGSDPIGGERSGSGGTGE